MSVRLWHSILYDYSVELVPMIGTKIDSGSGYGVFEHTNETVAAEALYMLSNGADKVGVHLCSVNSELLQIIGSYEKLKTVNCEVLAIAEEYMRYKNTATHQTNGSLSLPWVTVTGDAMTVGEMTARDGSGKTALLLAPADETADCHVTLSAPGKKLALHAGSETTQLLPDADGCCTFVLKDGMGVLLTAE
jgi:hypothetical protein